MLDPACGSGAFPMGMLQQMVHILNRIDPNNEQWKEMMLNNAISETSDAYRTATDEERAEIVADIERSFNESINRPDYARKLYLIENCIYGVDIQPIAIQISKLRFFISLVVDQKTNDNPVDNFGIRPLPNLEAKFVAANTLISIEKREPDLFTSEAVLNKEAEMKAEKQFEEAEMKDAKHRIFGAKTVKTKRKYKERVIELSDELAKMLAEIGAVGNEEAQQLASWDMFDQNATSSFFDSEWMFDVMDGFDIVIANPPYVPVGKEEKNQYQKLYSVIEGHVDLYELFIERGMMLLKDKGTLVFINPNTILSNLYSQKLRRKLVNEYGLQEITNFGMDVFEAVVHTCILRMYKGIKVHQIGVKKSVCNVSDLRNSVDCLLNLSDVEQTQNFTFDISLNDLERKLFDKLSNMMSLGEKCYLRQCIKTGNDKEYVRKSPIALSEPWKKTLRGKGINRYVIKEDNIYIKYGDWLARNWKNKSFYECKKIAIREAGKRITACLDLDNRYFLSSLYAIYPKLTYDVDDLKVLLAILNSTFATFYVQKIAFDLTQGAFTKIRTNQLARLPLPVVSKQKKDTIVKLVDKIIIEKNGREIEVEENEIDYIVYHLYGLTYDEVLIVDPETPITREEYEKE